MKQSEWESAMRVAATIYNISPKEFWQLSVREWRGLLDDGTAPMTRADFDILRAIYPDGDDHE